jgi:hypothetical protein
MKSARPVLRMIMSVMCRPGAGARLQIPELPAMEVEMHQLEQRYERLHRRQPGAERADRSHFADVERRHLTLSPRSLD